MSEFDDNCLTCGLYAESCRDKPKLFTAAEMKAARLETVERKERVCKGRGEGGNQCELK